MATKVGINGFGRIGRNFYRAYLEKSPGFELVAVNDLAPPDVLAHMLKYDSTHGVLKGEITDSEDGISVDGRSFRVLSERDASALPWKDMEVDVVVESTGLFTDREGASQHLTAGAKKVVISAPASDPDITIVLGVNDDKYDPQQHHLISNASCTTNSVGPMAKILLDTFGLESGFMTTIHAYTTEQQLQDQIAMTRKGKADLRRMRSAPQSIIPASTGAAKAIGEVIPELKGKLDRKEKFVLIDVREPFEYDICRIPGSRLIPLGQLPSRMSELDSADEIVLQCKSGARSARAVKLLQEAGFGKLWNVEGGIAAWADEVDPSVPKY